LKPLKCNPSDLDLVGAG